MGTSSECWIGKNDIVEEKKTKVMLILIYHGPNMVDVYWTWPTDYVAQYSHFIAD